MIGLFTDRLLIHVIKIMEINELFTEGFITHLSETDSKLGEFLKNKLYEEV